MRTLITGAAGFIGSHLVEACLNSGHDVHVIVRGNSVAERLRRFEPFITFHRFDLRSELELARCVRIVAPQAIYHLAASPRRAEDSYLTDARDFIGEDLGMLIGLLSAAAQTRVPPSVVVRAGSLAEYGSAPAPYREDTREHPLTLYGAGLVAATHLVGALQPRLPFPVVTARLALVYGPGQSTEYFLPWLVQRCLASEEATVRRPADRRDLIHIDDVVAALMRMASTRLPGGMIMNIATGIAPTMREVARKVVTLAGTDPELITYGEGNPASGAPDLRGSPERARELLGWSARVPLTEGISSMVRSYRGNRNTYQNSITDAPKRRGAGMV